MEQSNMSYDELLQLARQAGAEENYTALKLYLSQLEELEHIKVFKDLSARRNMTEEEINPIELDCIDLRKERQKDNNKKVYLGLINNFSRIKLEQICNEKELKRVLDEINITYEDLVIKCQNDSIMCKILAGRIAIQSSRQGSLDETYVLNKCNETCSKFGINIKSLKTDDLVPLKNGELLPRKEIRKQKINKTEYLKSFDGEIIGDKIQGLIFAKIAIGEGGHQDNVFEEAVNIAEWILKFGKEDKLYVLLIDTNLNESFNNIKNKYHKNNIIVVNHIDFQKYLIDNYNK